MGIFSRLADIVNSNLNSILASAEDPEKMIRLIIQEMEDTLVEVRSQAVSMIAERKGLERRARVMVQEEDEWLRKAELALTRDREDLAKGALAARATVEQSRKTLEQQIAQVNESLDQQHDDIGKLQAKLADAKSREKSLSLRHKAATNRIKTRERLTTHASKMPSTVSNRLSVRLTRSRGKLNPTNLAAVRVLRANRACRKNWQGLRQMWPLRTSLKPFAPRSETAKDE